MDDEKKRKELIWLKARILEEAPSPSHSKCALNCSADGVCYCGCAHCLGVEPPASAGPSDDERNDAVRFLSNAHEAAATSPLTMSSALALQLRRIKADARRAALEEAARHIEFNPPHNTGHVARATAANEIRELVKAEGRE
jgi:hypothetical protein